MRKIVPEPFNVYTYEELSDDAKKRAAKQLVLESYLRAEEQIEGFIERYNNFEFYEDGTFHGTYYGQDGLRGNADVER